MMDIFRRVTTSHAQLVNADDAGGARGADVGSAIVAGAYVPQRTQTPLEDWVPQAISTPLPSPGSCSTLLTPEEEWTPLATSTPRPQCQ
ncbi:uncharacterized protein B0H18DRAFT_131256 [Fomitopsis serialis]|uniref:uncharacterized protein n=1 Tax=Fomitopsis serialis TaxID=139415 RepID=UPI0020082BF4|nr:uncharacterized protein B0H18DRAFT_131256 [Neoantrodia serialis]KAH9930654.1 hypothetical protein B0H18DRAFT_131256 [Neoantrodia serialis]